MANNFKLIYKILSILEKSMEYDEFDENSISHNSLDISYPLWSRLIAMLSDNGYISGVQVWQPMETAYPKVMLVKQRITLTILNPMETAYPKVMLVKPQITLQGLEYLEENSLMQKAAKLAKGIKDVTPFM